MNFRQQMKHKFVAVFCVTSLLAVTLLGFQLLKQWEGEIADTGRQMARDATITATTLNQAVIDSTRLLDVTKGQLRELSLRGRFTPPEIRRALRAARSSFSVYSDTSFLGVLLAIGKDGMLMERSDDVPFAGIYLGDRYYFRELAEHPERNLVVGPMIVARTTGRKVFQVAERIVDAQGNFAGVLAFQVYPERFESVLRSQLSNEYGRMTILTPAKELVFELPPGRLTPTSQSGIAVAPPPGLPPAGNVASWQRLGDRVVAQIALPTVGLTVIAETPVSRIWAQFVEENATALLLALAVFAVVGALLWSLYRKIVEANDIAVQSRIDDLTGLPNRKHFYELYESVLRDAVRNHKTISVLFMDIDHFKQCNDTHGHETGDVVLRRIAAIVSSCMRRPFDTCFRWGGEELIALLPDTDLEGATLVAEHILESVRSTPIKVKGKPPIRMTVSVGIASESDPAALEKNNLVARADQAMYRAKQAGRDRHAT